MKTHEEFLKLMGANGKLVIKTIKEGEMKTHADFLNEESSGLPQKVKADVAKSVDAAMKDLYGNLYYKIYGDITKNFKKLGMGLDYANSDQLENDLNSFMTDRVKRAMKAFGK